MKLFKKLGGFVLSGAMVLGLIGGFTAPVMAEDENPYAPVEFVTHDGVTFGRATEAYQSVTRDGTILSYQGFPLFDGDEEHFDEYLDLLLEEMSIAGKVAIATNGLGTGSYEKDGEVIVYNIPAGSSVGGEALMGAAGQTAFSTVMYQAQSWNTDLINMIGYVMGVENKSKQTNDGFNWTTSTGTSMTDMRLNPLSGRYDEGYGEDSMMASVFADANAHGYNGYYTNEEGFYILANVNTKHYTVYNAQWFRPVTSTQVGVRSFYEYNAKSANRGFADGTIGSFMSSYGRINGVPSSASFITSWANDVSRYDLFNGTDAGADTPYLSYAQSGNVTYGQFGNGYDDTYSPDAGYKAASMAISGHKPSATADVLQNAITNGYNGITESSLDTIVSGYLTIRTRVGIYDEKDASGISKFYPFNDIAANENAVDYTNILSQNLALKNAEEGIVLLKNDNNVLPLAKDGAVDVYGVFSQAINAGIYQVAISDYEGRGEEAGYSPYESISERMLYTSYNKGLDIVTIQDSNDNYWYVDEDGTILLKTPEEFSAAEAAANEQADEDESVEAEEALPEEETQAAGEQTSENIVLEDAAPEATAAVNEAAQDDQEILLDDAAASEETDPSESAEPEEETDPTEETDPEEPEEPEEVLDYARFCFGILDSGQEAYSIYSYGAEKWLQCAISDPTVGFQAYAGWTNPLFPNPFEWQNQRSLVSVDGDYNFKNVPGQMLPPILSGYPYHLMLEEAENEGEYYIHAGGKVNGVTFVTGVAPLQAKNYGFYLEAQGGDFIDLGGAYTGARSDCSTGIKYFNDATDKSTMTFKINEIQPYGFETGLNLANDLTDTAIIFVGQTYLGLSGEGTDRITIDMGAGQMEMALNVAEAYKNAGKNTVVVVYANYPVNVEELQNCADIDAIVFAGYGGQYGGKATAEVLTGEYVPSGRLVSTWYSDMSPFPVISEYTIPLGNDELGYDTELGRSAFLENGLSLAEIDDSITVDMTNADVYDTEMTYKYLSDADLANHVTYPFGYGLTYTTFEFTNLMLPESYNPEEGKLYATVDITNTGDVGAFAIPQIYASINNSEYGNAVPNKSLVGFSKVYVGAGETVTATIEMDPKEDLAIWDVNAEDYILESGRYTFYAAYDSSLDGALSRDVIIAADFLAPAPEEELNIWEHTFDYDGLRFEEYSKIQTAAAAVEEGVGDDIYAVTSICDDAWAAIPNVNLDNAVYATITAGAPDGVSGTIEVRLDSREGELLTTFEVSSTGMAEKTLVSTGGDAGVIHELDYMTLVQPISMTGIHDLYLVFSNPGLRAGTIEFDYDPVVRAERAEALVEELKQEIATLLTELQAAEIQIMTAPGWHQREDGSWYFYYYNHTMAQGWGFIEGKWYFFDEIGTMQTGWLLNNGKWYFLNETSGAMTTGWAKINGYWYFFKPNGEMAASEWIDGYWLSANGAWTYQPRGSWRKNNVGWWYGDTSGWYAKNCTQKIDNVVYQFNAAGYWVK